MRKSRILNLDLDYKLENQNFILTYDGYIENERFSMTECSCGFKTYVPVKVCPNCQTDMVKKIHSIFSSYSYFIYEYSFDKLKSSIKLKQIKHECDIDKGFNKEISDIEIVLMYKLNKKNEYKYSAKMIVDGEEERLLKNNLSYLRFDLTKKEVKQTLDVIAGIRCDNTENLGETLWSINNKYKYCFDALQKDVYEGYEHDLQSLKDWNEFIKNQDEEDLKHLTKYALFINERNGRISAYAIKSFFNQHKKCKEDLYRHINILFEIKENALTERNNLPINWRYDTRLGDFMYEGDFTFDEVLELIALAERQAYDIGMNYYKVSNVYKNLNELGLPIDKKPKELAIYITKINKLLDMSFGRRYCNIALDQRKPLKGVNNKKTIKRLYDKFGYKGLDILLFNYYMNQELNPLYLSFPQRNGDYITTDIIAFFNVTNNNTNIEINNIKSILTEDNEFIEDKEEILRYIKKTYDRIFENKEKRQLEC